MSPVKYFLSLLGVFTGAKDFRRNPVLGSAWLNAKGLHVARKRLANGLCQFRRWMMAGQVPAAWRHAYQHNGFVRIDDFLSPAEFDRLRRDVASLQARCIRMTQGSATTRRFNLDGNTCRNLPALNALVTNKRLLWLMRYVAGYWGQPIIAVQIIRSNPELIDGERDPQTDWHSDTFHSTAKAWFFMHSVAEDEGPFAYVPESHRCTPERLAWEKQQSICAQHHANILHSKGSFRVSPDEMADLGYVSPVMGTTMGNTVVVADTSGFHRRTPTQQATCRVEIYMSLRRNPFWAGLYPSLLGLPLVRYWWAEGAWNMYREKYKRGDRSWEPMDECGLSEDEKLKVLPLT